MLAFIWYAVLVFADESWKIIILQMLAASFGSRSNQSFTRLLKNDLNETHDELKKQTHTTEAPPVQHESVNPVQKKSNTYVQLKIRNTHE